MLMRVWWRCRDSVRSPQWSILGLVVLAAGLGGSCYAAFLWGWWIPSVSPLLALGVAEVAASIIKSRQQERLQLRQVLERIVAAGREQPAAGRIALEYLKQSETARNQRAIEQWLQELEGNGDVSFADSRK